MTASLDDTICAIATPIGEGGIGIVRVSGADALRIAAHVVVPRRGCALHELRSHCLYLATVQGEPPGADLAVANPESAGPTVVDEVLVVVMRAPRSYTGEEVVEIHCHGGSLILTMVCDALVRHGARLAQPGEFTRRAFLQGRLDLTQAEAVLDTIHATTTTSLRLAHEQRQGALSVKVEGWRDRLVTVLAHLEAGLDFAEEDITFLGRDALRAELEAVQGDLASILRTWEQGRVIREGVNTAIVGRPNVGKSSLLNALAEHDRAIVSRHPGTTRDIVEEAVNIGGIVLRVMDTAGMRDAGDEVEQEGIRRTQATLDQAELLFVVIDRSAGMNQDDRALLRRTRNRKRVVVLNKSDLPGKVGVAEVMACASGDTPEPQAECRVVTICAPRGDGLDDLRTAVIELMQISRFEARDSVMVTRLRHQQALAEAQTALGQAHDALTSELPGDCLAVDVRSAVNSLGEITGSVSTDDVLDKVFSEFCIGK